MKIVFTSDVHVHPHRIGSVDGRGRDRLADGLSALDQTLAFAREYKAVWAFGGDMKGPKDVWIVDSLNGVRATLARYPDVPKLGIPGNHDRLDGSHGGGLESLREYMTIFDRPTVQTFEDERTPKKVKPRDLVTFAAWPWGAGRCAELDPFLSDAERARKRGETVVLLAHLMFAGMLPQADAARPERAVAVEDFRPGDAFDLALVGDVHRGQVYLAPSNLREARTWKPFSDYAARVSGGSKTSSRRPPAATETRLSAPPAIPLRAPGPWRGETWYPGSPYAQNFGERDDWPKGALLVDTVSGAVDLLPVKAPRFREIEVKTAEAFENLAGQRWEDDVVRLIAPAAFFATKGVTAEVQKLWKTSGARSLTPIPRREVVDARRAPVHGGMTPEELVREYVKARPLDGLDASVLARAGVELLVERDEGDDRVA